VYRKGWKFTTLIEECDVAYFPAVQNGHEANQGCKLLGWLGSAFKWLCCHGAPFHPSALRIQFFWTWRWTSLDQDHVDHDLCRIVGLPGLRVEDQLPYSMTCRRRLSEQLLDSNRGRFAAEEGRWGSVYHISLPNMCH
jgi:hypothetical protein